MAKKQEKAEKRTKNKPLGREIITVMLWAAALLVVPLLGNMFVDGWNWSGSDFVFAWVLWAGAGIAYKAVSRKIDNKKYRIAVGLAVLTGLALVWVNAAVGIIGDDNPANLMYGGVLIVGIIGAIASRLRPKGMARTLFAVALVQMLVPLIALMAWSPQVASWAPGVFQVFVLNAFFAVLWVGSALLFRQAGQR